MNIFRDLENLLKIKGVSSKNIYLTNWSFSYLMMNKLLEAKSFSLSLLKCGKFLKSSEKIKRIAFIIKYIIEFRKNRLEINDNIQPKSKIIC